jgi:hypothetical protein
VRAVQYSDGSLDDDIEIIVHGASCDDALNSDHACELASLMNTSNQSGRRLGSLGT